MSESQEHKIEIKGGTFALCLWLYIIALGCCGIENQLERIANVLEGKPQRPNVIERIFERQIQPETPDAK